MSKTINYKHKYLNKLSSPISKLSNPKGFSLLELVVVIIISAIILSSLIILFRDFMRTHRRQERIMLIERSLKASEIALRDSLITLPGRGLATSSGTSYSLPNLPIAGSIYDGIKNTPIRLGIITPYKINGNDAFTVIYSDAKVPRLGLDTNFINQVGTSKIVRVPLPNYVQLGFNQIKNKRVLGDLGDLGDGSPQPTNNNDLSPIPAVDMFETGQLMMLVEAPNFSNTTQKLNPTFATLVKLVSVSKVSVGSREFLQFTLDSCQTGNCGQLTNDPLATTNLTPGSILVPVKFTSFYLQKDNFGNKLVRNDGGLILPNGDGFGVVGGKETIVGETDVLTINYHLRDESIMSTPNTPIVPWLKDILSVDITLLGQIPSTQGTELFERVRKFNFPILSQNLE